MSGNEYWRICLEGALDVAGCPDALTSEQLDKVATSLASSAENEGTATGRDCIPHPLLAEMERIEQQHARDMKDAARDIEAAEARTSSARSELSHSEFRRRNPDWRPREA